MVGFCTSPLYMRHDPGLHHPERPNRLQAIMAAVREAGLVLSPNPVPFEGLAFGYAARDRAREPLVELTPHAATVEEVCLVHPLRHVQRVHQRSQSGGLMDEGDTPVGPGSYDAAMLAVGGVLTCCDAVISGQVRRAFAAIRPPGHHAHANESSGFCLFSNVAIAARYLQQVHGLERIAIVDFDVHHGNGTQSIFQADPSVLFVSLHQNPHCHYPGSGFVWEIGVGAGRGTTLNIAMTDRADDNEYLQAMDEQVIPAVDRFRPEAILVSAGFDAHKDDPLADMRVTEDGYAAITRRLVGLAEQHCAGRVISALEGGYNLIALGRSVVAHLDAMQ